KKSLQSQYYNPDVKAKRRAFSLKQGYMSGFINDYVLEAAKTYDDTVDMSITEETFNEYILEATKTYDDIIDTPVTVETFEEIVLNKLMSYKGYSEEQLRKEFDLVESKSKNIFSRLALKILDVDTETADEFVKSNTQVKAIRLEEDGSIKEHMSFPAINFIEFAKEDWEESYLYNYFTETRFLYVIYQQKDVKYYLDDAMFWHMPLEDLDGPGYKDWLAAQKAVIEGVKFKQSGAIVYNSLP